MSHREPVTATCTRCHQPRPCFPYENADQDERAKHDGPPLLCSRCWSRRARRDAGRALRDAQTQLPGLAGILGN